MTITIKNVTGEVARIFSPFSGLCSFNIVFALDRAGLCKHYTLTKIKTLNDKKCKATLESNAQPGLKTDYIIEIKN